MIAVETNILVYAHREECEFHDARIAAICLENAVAVLCTADRDFGRFKALKTINPLIR